MPYTIKKTRYGVCNTSSYPKEHENVPTSFRTSAEAIALFKDLKAEHPELQLKIYRKVETIEVSDVTAELL